MSVPFQLFGLRNSYVVPRGSVPRSATQSDCACAPSTGASTTAAQRLARSAKRPPPATGCCRIMACPSGLSEAAGSGTKPEGAVYTAQLSGRVRT